MHRDAEASRTRRQGVPRPLLDDRLEASLDEADVDVDLFVVIADGAVEVRATFVADLVDCERFGGQIVNRFDLVALTVNHRS